MLRRAEIASVFDRCYRLIPAASAEELLPLVEEFSPDVLLICQEFAGKDTLLLVEKAKALVPHVIVIVVSECGDMDFAVNALKSGAVTVMTGVPSPDVLYSSVAGKIPPDGDIGGTDMPWKIKGC